MNGFATNHRQQTCRNYRGEPHWPAIANGRRNVNPSRAGNGDDARQRTSIAWVYDYLRCAHRGTHLQAKGVEHRRPRTEFSLRSPEGHMKRES